jgi:hypothetical protein
LYKHLYQLNHDFTKTGSGQKTTRKTQKRTLPFEQGTMDDPGTGEPSFTGQLVAGAKREGNKPPFLELTGAHLAMPSSCMKKGGDS